MWKSSPWPVDRKLSRATNTPSLIESGSNGNEGIFQILQSSNTGASPSDCLMSYPGHSLEESYPFEKKQSVYSMAQADWAR